MRAAFRVDGSDTVGSGHVMRCLTLAHALRRHTVSSIFLCRALPPYLRDRIASQGFEVSVGPSASSVGTPWEVDAPEDAAVSGMQLRMGVDILVVDHYALDAVWEREMRRHTRVLLAIDDLADRNHDCDVLLDANLMHRMEQRYDGLVPARCRRLLGPAYALLRDEFRTLPRTTPRAGHTVRHVLVAFGGTDPDNLTERVLDELSDANVTADAVLGTPNHPRRTAVERRCRESGGRFRLHIRTDRMAELMAGADVALGAGGTSHWERCRMGLPTIVVTVASNQVETTRILAEKGACLWLGNVAELEPGSFRRALDRFRSAPHARVAMRNAARAIVPDGHGADRVADILVRLACGGAVKN